MDQEIASASAVQLPTYDGKNYTFTSVTPAEKLVLVADEASNVIVLRYDRETATTYTVRHDYYTNDALTGSVTTDLEGNVITEGVAGTVDQEIGDRVRRASDRL